MLENLTLWQRIRLRISDIPYMGKPLNSVEDFFEDYAIYGRYILALFALTLLFIIGRLALKWIWYLSRSSLYSINPLKDMTFWERFQMEDERRYLKDVKDIFEEEQKYPRIVKAQKETLPAGLALLQQIMMAIGQGLGDGEIMKILPSNYALIDVLPIIEAVRSFRDLAAQKILDPKSRERRDYARALKEMAMGKPERATKMMKKELVRQQHVLFGLRDKLLQQYARKEASRLALNLGLLLGVYDTRLAEKAYQRSMELNPKDSKSFILYGRFRQRTIGTQDKVMEKTFLKLAKGIDKTLQSYMINYAVEMVRKSEIRSRQEEIKSRIQDERERYNEAVNIERLKVNEALTMAKMRSIAEEVHIR